MISYLLALLLPPHCVSCKALLSRPGLCSTCRNSVLILDALSCATCRRRSPSFPSLCHPRTPYALAALSLYEPPLSSIVKALKYRRARAILPLLSEFVAQYFTQIDKDFSGFIVTPIPLHAAKKRQRGFNQAELIAAVVARQLNLPVVNLLERTRATASQAKLSQRAQRRENVAGAFSTKSDTVVGKNIILVDDVFTSGATMNEAVRTLRRAGTKTIVGFVICKTKT